MAPGVSSALWPSRLSWESALVALEFSGLLPLVVARDAAVLCTSTLLAPAGATPPFLRSRGDVLDPPLDSCPGLDEDPNPAGLPLLSRLRFADVLAVGPASGRIMSAGSEGGSSAVIGSMRPNASSAT